MGEGTGSALLGHVWCTPTVVHRQPHCCTPTGACPVGGTLSTCLGGKRRCASFSTACQCQHRTLAGPCLCRCFAVVYCCWHTTCWWAGGSLCAACVAYLIQSSTGSSSVCTMLCLHQTCCRCGCLLPPLWLVPASLLLHLLDACGGHQHVGRQGNYAQPCGRGAATHLGVVAPGPWQQVC